MDRTSSSSSTMPFTKPSMIDTVSPDKTVVSSECSARKSTTVASTEELISKIEGIIAQSSQDLEEKVRILTFRVCYCIKICVSFFFKLDPHPR